MFAIYESASPVASHVTTLIFHGNTVQLMMSANDKNKERVNIHTLLTGKRKGFDLHVSFFFSLMCHLCQNVNHIVLAHILTLQQMKLRNQDSLVSLKLSSTLLQL